MRTLLLAILSIASPLASANTIIWPDLPETCFVSGRSATSADVDTGCAAFLINVKGEAAGTPIKLDIPQYAMHVDETTGKETPVIIIQAERERRDEGGGLQGTGHRSARCRLLREVRPLGIKKPGLALGSTHPATILPVVTIITLHPMRMHITVALAHRLPMAVYRNVTATRPTPVTAPPYVTLTDRRLDFDHLHRAAAAGRPLPHLTFYRSDAHARHALAHTRTPRRPWPPMLHNVATYKPLGR